MSTFILSPGTIKTATVERNPPLTDEQINALGRPDFTLFIYGEARYRDVFGIDRYTNYRLLYRGSRKGNVGELVSDTEGNDAN